jgi:hypothetical protein
MTAEAELFDAPRVEQREKALAEIEAINAEIDEILHFYRVPDGSPSRYGAGSIDW